MLLLKDYQQRTLDTLQAYFRACHQFTNVSTAFYDLTSKLYRGQGLPYRPVQALPGLPYVCLRIPTGGGKTLVACHTVGITKREYLQADQVVVLWLVPSNAIREQTIKALKNKKHPYHQALEATLGTVHVLDIKEALFVQPSTLSTGTTIVVSTMQAFRVEDTEGRHVYEASGALMSHFSGKVASTLSGGERYENGEPIPSLANVLRLHRPLVIVDEAHNARTSLSFDTLARFYPSCIVEFTATPDTRDNPSNVLYSVSAAELKAENMIKMPIHLETRSNWRELIGDAVSILKRLEAAAIEERSLSGEYIRPIMLLQAQPRYKDKESLTVDVVEKCLIDDYKIPTDQIARATGTEKGIEGVDLSDSSCPIRYVITVQALREGWDCPFAYVLCSVAEMSSSTAVEQILGRVLRQPKATQKLHPELNRAYAFAASANFASTANELADALVQNGFEKQEAKDLIAPLIQKEFLGPLFSQQPNLPEEVAISIQEVPVLESLPAATAAKVSYNPDTKTLSLKSNLEPPDIQAIRECFLSSEDSQVVEQAIKQAQVRGKANAETPAERGEIFAVPRLVVQQANLFEPFEETHFLDFEWDITKCDASLSKEEFPSDVVDATDVEIDISDMGKIQTRFLTDLKHQMTLLEADKGWSTAELVFWLDRSIPHKDITPQQSGVFLTRMLQSLQKDRGLSVEKLVHEKYRLREAAIGKIETHRKSALQTSYQQFLLPNSPTPLTVTPAVLFQFDPNPLNYPCPPNSLYRGRHQFKKHYYPHVGDLKSSGEEYECAQFIEALPEVKMWVRNLDSRPYHSFWLQISTGRFYPDFVCQLHDSRYLVVEYKGEHLYTDAEEKRIIGELWEKRSNGQCLFIMPTAKKYDLIRTKITQTR